MSSASSRAPSSAPGGIRRSWKIDVGGGDQLQRASRHQPRVAGPGADQVDDPGQDPHASASARSRMSRAPAASSRSASSAPSRVGSVESPSSPSRSHSLPSGRPTKASRPHPAAVEVDRPWTPSGLLQLASSRATTVRSAVSSRERRPVGDRLDRRSACSSPSRVCSSSAPWPPARGHRLARQREGDLVLAAQPAQAGDGEHDPVEVALLELPQAGVDVAVQLDRPPGRGARRAAARAGAGSRCRPGRPAAPPRARSRSRSRRRRDPRAAAPRRSPGPRAAPPAGPWPSARRGRHRRRAAPARPRVRSGPCRPDRRRRRPRPARRRRASRRPGPPGQAPAHCLASRAAAARAP